MAYTFFSMVIFLSYLFAIINNSTTVELIDRHSNVTTIDEDGPGQLDSISSKIYKGTRSRAYPFMAVIVRVTPLLNNARAICGATILDENNLLTAAHCIQPIIEAIDGGGRIEAWLGGSDLGKRFHIFQPQFQQKIPLDRNRLFAHPNFIGTPDDLTNDIGILGLSHPIRFNEGSVQRICIGTRDYDGQPATTIGYGLTKCIKSESNRLLSASGKVLNAENCVRAGHEDNLVDSQVCAQFGNWLLKSTTMPGDSGGPLFGEYDGQYVQIGITSYGRLFPIIYCPKANIPPTFTRAGAFRQFIQIYAPTACFV